MTALRTSRASEPRERSGYNGAPRVSASVGEADYGETSPKHRERGSAQGGRGGDEVRPPQL